MPAQPANGETATPARVQTASPDAPAPGVPLIELLNVSKSFATGNGPAVTILDQVDLQVGEGEMLALLGQSGSGKSTILRLMAGLAQPTSGQVHHHGQVFAGVNRGLSIVFQSFALYPWLTVSENVQIGLVNQRLARAAEDAEIERTLELIGLSGYENAYPKELSGGMRQRVGIRPRHRRETRSALHGRGVQRAGRAHGREPAHRSRQSVAGPAERAEQPQEHLLRHP